MSVNLFSWMNKYPNHALFSSHYNLLMAETKPHPLLCWSPISKQNFCFVLEGHTRRSSGLTPGSSMLRDHSLLTVLRGPDAEPRIEHQISHRQRCLNPWIISLYHTTPMQVRYWRTLLIRNVFGLHCIQTVGRSRISLRRPHWSPSSSLESHIFLGSLRALCDPSMLHLMM